MVTVTPVSDHALTVCRDVDVPVHVFLTLIFEFFHTSMRLHAAACCDSKRGANAKSDTVTIDVDRVAKPSYYCIK